MVRWRFDPIGGTAMADWVISDDQGVAALDDARLVGVGEQPPEPLPAPIALRLHDIVVHDNKKWFNLFGGAEVRVDVLVVQGNLLDEQNATSFYTPTTHRFGDVRDETTLPLDEGGLLAFYGWPKHFLDMSVMVSRDTDRADDLAVLLSQAASSPELKASVDTALQLAAGGGALIVRNALEAAAVLGGFAYKLLRQVSGNTIGVYHGNRLEFPQQFGLGQNPPDGGAYRQQDMSLRFDVMLA